MDNPKEEFLEKIDKEEYNINIQNGDSNISGSILYIH